MWLRMPQDRIRPRGDTWVRGQRRLFSGLAAALGVALLVASCATTPAGQAYQAAYVLVVANEQVLGECRNSRDEAWRRAAAHEGVGNVTEANRLKAEWIEPLTQKTCKGIATAYKVAWKAAKKAIEITGQGQPTPVQLAALGIRFVYDTSIILADAGVKPAKDVQGFLDQTSALLLAGRN